MSDVLLVLQLAIELTFALLGIRTIVSWVQQPDRRHASLAIGLSSLALLVLISPQITSPGAGGQVLTDVALVLFLGAGYALFAFRDSFVRSTPAVRWGLAVAVVVIGLADLALQLPATLDSPHTPLQTLAVVLTIGVWAFCVADPIATFWQASRGRPAVERSRLRALSAGYAGLLLVIVVGTVAGSLNPVITVAVDVLSLVIVPLLYVAFFPPASLRRIWRQPEEDQFRLALHDLLLYSPDRATLADRALLWSERLIGGEAAFVLDGDGSVLATRGISSADAAARSHDAAVKAVTDASSDHAPRQSGSTIAFPLDLRQGRGAMVIISGRLSAMFGDDELSRMRQYATSISAGLDRVTLNSRIAALERAKTDFLNIASHELRGPMTVIKGYLTMLEAESLGAIPSRARAVLPLLISKSDEVNWMIEQMMEVARLEEGKLALKVRRADIVELTDAALDGVKMLLSGHDVDLDSPAQPIDADVDPDRFQIVVRNLLSNAAKYSPAGTDIDIGIKRNGDKALVTVTDHGVGISEENQKTLFTRFGRIENDAAVQGTGLGLWLSREIARMHEGDLTVNSRAGVGSTFTLSVPLSR